MTRPLIKTALLLALLLLPISRAAEENTFRPVAELLAEHCLDCHSADEPEGKLVLDSYASLLKGGETGPAIVPGQSGESLLVQMIEGSYEKDGKVRIMPPGRREKLTTAQIAIIKAWVDAGAPAPLEDTTIAREIVAPKIEPKAPPPPGIHALAYDPAARLLAVARPGGVELHSAEDQHLIHKLEPHPGQVNALTFSPDGKTLFAAGGEHGISGMVSHWNVSDGRLLRTIEAHKDTIFGLALSPDGKTLATGSYDQKIKLWNPETGEEIRTLTGHNGCVYALAFRADGKILASASGDRTVKLWDLASGERRDTLSQPLKELYTLAFSPDGKRLAAAGVDNRIRTWEISESAAETTNPLLYSKFGHDGAILRVVFSADGKQLASSAEDRSLKIWDAAEMQERLALEPQPDWAPALAFVLDGRGLAVGRLDGSLAYYNTKNGSALQPPAPEITSLQPRGIQRGVETKLKVTGKHLHRAESIAFSHPALKGELLSDPAPAPGELWIRVTSSHDLPRGPYDLRIKTPSGESKALTLFLDDLPQVIESASSESAQNVLLPATIWGAHENSGEADHFNFEATAGQTILFDAAAKSINSKADLVLTIVDAKGKVLASANGTAQSADPLLAWTAPENGTYSLLVTELVLAGSPEHFYRISAGDFPFVTAWYPSAIQDGEEREIKLIGHNLPEGSSTRARAEKGKPLEFTIDPEKFRLRREARLTRLETSHNLESEPNDVFSNANTITAPAALSGRLWSEQGSSDEDWFRFEATEGENWIIETMAAQIGSPLDTKIEIRDAHGQPVVRTILQAVRDSAVTFRPIDSNTMDCRVEHWEEMELNQLLYLQGEVVKLFRAPQGPDSGFLFYGINGKRRTYFDTTPTTHANEEPCYIVEAHPPGAELVPTGLPIFPVHFENDDDGERRLGTDSRVHFTPPKTGVYTVRVADTRDFSGPDFTYVLVVRKAAPDFKVSLAGANPKVAPGSGAPFTLNAERIDGFEGEIRVEISNVPEGFTVSNPVVIQAGHMSASGTIFAAPDAAQPAPEHRITLTATATIRGKTVQHELNDFGKITLADKAPLYVTLEPIGSAAREITIAPGGTVPALLKIRRNGHDDRVTFTVDNLPHGIIVDNIGLNGVLIPPDQNEREIFLTAEKWVPETDRLCHAVSNEAGRQSSLPLLVKVRKTAGQIAGK